MCDLKRALLVLVFAAACVPAATAAPALATGPVWETCKSDSEGLYKNNLCTETGEKGGFEWGGLNETEEVTSSDSVELEDSAATGGKVIVSCTGTSSGTVGAEGQGSVIKVTPTSCKFVNKEHGSCEESKGVTPKAINLPWGTHLEERENTESKIVERRDLIRSLSTKPPGWAIECTVGGIFIISDECTGGANTSVASNEEAGTVESEFEGGGATGQEPASCTLGNSTSGHVRGTITTKAKNGTELQVVGVIGVVVRPKKWKFKKLGEAGQKVFKIINATPGKEEVKSGKINPNENVFKVAGGSGCFTKKPYIAGASCPVTIQAEAANGKGKLEIVPLVFPVFEATLES
jgi:hypothetical protein